MTTIKTSRASPSNRLVNIYLLNLSLLVAHEIDSAYWREWELFGLPGGIQFFVLLHIGLVGLFLIGFKQVLLGEPWGLNFSFILAGAGMLAFSIHSVFMILGYEQFRLPVSLVLLFALFLVSLWQIWQTLQESKTLEVRR